MAAKRYRSTEHRTFHRAASYTEGRIDEALARRARAQAQEHLRPAGRRRRVGGLRVGRARCGSGTLGLPVPYPVQIDGTEILMEWITVVDEDGTADRAPAGPDPARARRCWRRTSSSSRDALATMVQNGVVHGDLSAYNILAAGDRLVIIDLPQIVDLVGNLNGMDFLHARLRQRLRLVPVPRARGRRARAVRRADGPRVLTTRWHPRFAGR